MSRKRDAKQKKRQDGIKKKIGEREFTGRTPCHPSHTPGICERVTGAVSIRGVVSIRKTNFAKKYFSSKLDGIFPELRKIPDTCRKP